jgi:hypothetical protein
MSVGGCGWADLGHLANARGTGDGGGGSVGRRPSFFFGGPSRQYLAANGLWLSNLLVEPLVYVK